MITTDLDERLKATAQRYGERARQRAETRQRLEADGILHADDPARVTKRLARLNADWTLARAIEDTPRGASTGRSLGIAMTAENFGADVLGLERLMGRNDLVDVGFLERGYRAARSIGRITVRLGGALAYGTGALISPRLLLTNHHVLHSAEEASGSYVEFNYQAGLDGMPLTPVSFPLDPATFFVTDTELDFSIVALRPGGDLGLFGWLQLHEQEGKVILGELVNIIQHPNGEPKQLAVRENKVVDLLDRFLHYETDTAPGSSGSPVFNDQWEVVALHHSGVPKTDPATGRFLTIDGKPWTPDMGEDRLAWEANEGIRISRVLGALHAATLTGAAADLRAQVFEATAAAAPEATGAAVVPGGSATFDLPVRVTIHVAADLATTTTNGAPAAAPVDDAELHAALVDLEASSTRTYFDAAADAAAARSYYAAIDPTADPDAFYRALSELVTRSHANQLRYKPMRNVYPWVDLHPDRKLHSVYSGQIFDPAQFIQEDAVLESARAGRLRELVAREVALGPAALEAELLALEAALPFNCEHSVPQSSFAAAEPMRGDLHHLFACESGCNSFRGNTPYFDFADFEEVVRDDCGRREPERFEPNAGKGAVARATLYFLLRYPGKIGDETRELQKDRLNLLLGWHAKHRVDEYEHHRNAAIAELQGNRNPLVDHPEWADRIAFVNGFG
jgi:endonuclease G